jgi:hypothetical protein
MDEHTKSEARRLEALAGKPAPGTGPGLSGTAAAVRFAVPAHWAALARLVTPARGVRYGGYPGGREMIPFLARVPHDLRRPVAERFLRAAQGAADPDAVLAAVRTNLGHGPVDEAIRGVLRNPLDPEYVTSAGLAAAFDLARWALWWSSLSPGLRGNTLAEYPAWEKRLEATTPEQRMRWNRRPEILDRAGGNQARADRWVLTGEEPRTGVAR